MNEFDLAALIRSRRAIRSYQDREVPRELLEHILQTAMWAPSAHNRQPWRFAVLSSKKDIERLAVSMGKRLREDRLQDGDELDLIERDVSRSYSRITGAPIVIGLFLSMKDMDQYPDPRRNQAEHVMAVQSVAMAAQNLWLLAHHAGLGACWMCAPLFVPQLVSELLQVPDDWQAQGMMTLGWPAEEKEKTRRPWKDSIIFL